ncbi:MAG: protein translocase subunit SecF [Xanthobacteraceae bacterium]
MRWRRVFFPVSAILSLFSVILFFSVGLNVGIDFRGGTLIEVQAKSGPADVIKLRESLGALGLGDVQLQEFGGPNDILIRFEQQPGGDAAQLVVVEKVKATLGNAYEYRRVEIVGPTVSSELLQLGIVGVSLSLFCIWLYLWFRFEWEFAVGAMVATMHDLTLIIGFYAFTQVDFDLSSVAVILTIAGYSLNDTVVVFDRIRELLRRYKKMSINELLDLAINTTLPRTVITGATTFLALLGLTFFGGEVLQSFTQAMLFGVIVGIYSTTFIASPILIYLGVRTQIVAGSSTPAKVEAKSEATAR